MPPARFHIPPFKPYVRFSRIRLNDDLRWSGLRWVARRARRPPRRYSQRVSLRHTKRSIRLNSRPAFPVRKWLPQPRKIGVESSIICLRSVPAARGAVISRTRSRSRLVAFGPGHRCMYHGRGFRWMLRFFRIVHPGNTKLSLPRLKSTIRVLSGCGVRPIWFITRSIRRSASLACD